MRLITIKIQENKDGTWIVERGIPGERKTFKKISTSEMFYRGVEALIKIMHSPVIEQR